jgi:hypothetical protein
MRADGKLNHRLPEQTPSATQLPPHVFPGIVGLKVETEAEIRDALL